VPARNPPSHHRGIAHRGPREDRGVIAERILKIARASFAEQGYAATTLRSVARDADVDPALISYYFHNKSGLLDAALVPPHAWTDRLAAAAATPIADRGAHLVRCLIVSWEDDPVAAEFHRAAILTAAHEPIALQRLAANFATHILNAVSARIDDDERLLRASLASTQMVGLAITRYIWQAGPIATLPRDDVIRTIAPTIQRYLNGPLHV
jgi:AcrR family transcriptional regulator